MRVKYYKCPGCNKEHMEKVYESHSEAVADIFTEQYFQPMWEMLKDKASETTLEEFAKRIVSVAIYNYHKNRRRIRVEKSSIQPGNGTED